jgi:catechol 2,3-dioxygenase-like lactoylglutathione lyase family enzyme
MFEETAFIAFTTADLVQAKRFWVILLGFPIVREDENYLMVDACGVRLCFDLPDGGEHRTPVSDGVVGLKVQDVDAVLTTLRSRGVEAVSGPFKGDQGRWAKLVDPDGRTVILTEHD